LLSFNLKFKLSINQIKMFNRLQKQTPNALDLVTPHSSIQRQNLQRLNLQRPARHYETIQHQTLMSTSQTNSPTLYLPPGLQLHQITLYRRAHKPRRATALIIQPGYSPHYPAGLQPSSSLSGLQPPYMKMMMMMMMATMNAD